MHSILITEYDVFLYFIFSCYPRHTQHQMCGEKFWPKRPVANRICNMKTAGQI